MHRRSSLSPYSDVQTQTFVSYTQTYGHSSFFPILRCTDIVVCLSYSDAQTQPFVPYTQMYRHGSLSLVIRCTIPILKCTDTVICLPYPDGLSPYLYIQTVVVHSIVTPSLFHQIVKQIFHTQLLALIAHREPFTLKYKPIFTATKAKITIIVIRLYPSNGSVTVSLFVTCYSIPVFAQNYIMPFVPFFTFTLRNTPKNVYLHLQASCMER